MSVLVGMLAMAVGLAPVETLVTFSGAGGFELYGTLTRPSAAAGPARPAVLLLPGSGPTDRDGNAPGIVIDLLKQISQALAASGFVTLRFDKRSVPKTYYAKFPKDRADWDEFFRWDKFVDDATDALRFLEDQPGVDSKRVAIVGHSEGAELALQIGSNMDGIAGHPAAIVTIGGAGRPMGPIIVEQVTRRLGLQNAPEPTKRRYLNSLNETIAQSIKDSTYPSDILPGLTPLFGPGTRLIMHSYLTIDPARLAKNYPGPVLLVNGGNDTQISPERDTPLLKEALQSRSSGSVETLIVPDASHNLKSTKDGNNDAMKGPADPLAIAKIKQFLSKQLHP